MSEALNNGFNEHSPSDQWLIDQYKLAIQQWNVHVMGYTCVVTDWY